MVATVLNPVDGELFTAVKGEGAQLNGDPIGVSRIDTLQDSLLVTGFPYNLREQIDTLSQRFKQCVYASQGVRRLGSAALDLCYTACGRFEGFWEQDLSPWDTAAGALLVSEAGGKVTNFSDDPFDPKRGEILATNGKIHHDMIELLKLKGDL